MAYRKRIIMYLIIVASMQSIVINMIRQHMQNYKVL
nr:MAG TPA: hypothetical protein [Caudoviricetes sp.]